MTTPWYPSGNSHIPGDKGHSPDKPQAYCPRCGRASGYTPRMCPQCLDDVELIERAMRARSPIRA